MGTIQIDGSTPKLTIGNATAEDATILFDGNAQDFYIALDDSADDLIIGLGSTVGTTPLLSFTEAGAATFKNVGTGDDNPMVLTLQTAEIDMAANDIIGAIQFQAPDEGTGTDAILVSAAIKAYAEGNHSSSSNATTLGFYTGASEAAAIKMTLSSAGHLDVTGDITGSTINADGDTAAGDNAAIGYTAAEGLILTGQGSTSDVTVKNDADGTVFTIPTGTDDILFPDSAKAMWEAGSDLQLYHDGSHSYIVDNGTGNLKIQGSQVDILGSGETMATFADDGAVTLYHNNVAKLATASDGINVGGTADGFIHCTDEHLYLKTDSAKHIIFQTNGANERMRILSGGCLVIGTDDIFTSGSRMDIRGAASSTATSISIGTNGQKGMSFQNASYSEQGSITINSGSVAFNTSSDYRLKENQTAITDGIDRIKQLKPYRFNFKADPDTTVDGFFAHEVSSIVPEAITGEKDAMHPDILYTADDELPEGKNIGDVKVATKINPQGIDQSKLIPILVASIIELEARVKTLEG